MAHITELHSDLLHLIFILLATSDDGARGLARIGATCETLMSAALDPRILKIANFQNLVDTTDFRKHHNVHDLLYVCALSGNQAAQSILGKALLLHDKWFWRMIMEDYQRALCWCLEPHLVLHHHNLVRTFILHATTEEMAKMCKQLLNYVILHAGYKAAHDNGLLSGIFRMCTYERAKLMVSKEELEKESLPAALTFYPFATIVVHLRPTPETLYRDSVIDMFDELFPSARG